MNNTKNSSIFKWIILIAILLAIGGFLLYTFFGNNNSNNSSNYDSSRISLNTTINNNSINSNPNSNNVNNSTKKTVETKISSFSTPIVDDNKNRVSNIKITCSRISNTIVNSNEEFSFCKVVGQPSSSDGYKEAHAFVDGELTNAIGGGNCQVSSTLYNAAKKIDGVEITERHEHGKDVSYVPEGRDAAVSYGSLDLKFRNDTGLPIRIEASSDDKNITTRIIQLS